MLKRSEEQWQQFLNATLQRLQTTEVGPPCFRAMGWMGLALGGDLPIGNQEVIATLDKHLQQVDK